MSLVLEACDAAKTYTNQKRFDCGHDVINKFVAGSLKKRVERSLSRGFVLLDTSQEDRFAGFYTLDSHTVEAPLLDVLSKGSLPRSVPCARLVMLGVDKAYSGHGLGSRLMRDAILRTILVSESIGVFGLYLDADPKAVAFYLKMSFVPLVDIQTDKPTPMFLHIETAKQALS